MWQLSIECYKKDGMNKIVLITGVYGFLGRYTAKCFAHAGWKVVGIGHGDWSATEAGQWGVSEWWKSDINFDRLSSIDIRPDIVVHCAGGNNVGYSFQYPLSDFQRTVDTLVQVFEYLRQNAPEAILLYPSSGAVYGVAQRFPIRETDQLAPVSPYGEHKILAENICRLFGRYFNVRSRIVRFFSLYGPGLRRQILYDACVKATRRDPLFQGTGNETRDFLHVEDAARLLYMLHHDESGGCIVVNGGSGVKTTIRECVNTLFQLMEAPCRPIFSGAIRVGDPVCYQADISSALTYGWRPSIDINAGLEGYVRWFKEDR